MRNRFKVGDMVRVCNIESTNYMRRGQIDEVNPLSYSKPFKVKMLGGYNAGMSYWFGEFSLESDESEEPFNNVNGENFYLLYDEMDTGPMIFRSTEELEKHVNEVIDDEGPEAIDMLHVYKLSTPQEVDLNLKAKVGD